MSKLAQGLRGSPTQRKREEFHRAYGSDSRVRWVRNRPCVFCGGGPCDNAHGWRDGTGGVGMKGHHTTIVPACRSCHHEMDHGIGKRAMEEKYGVDLKAEAARIESEYHVEF